MAQEQLNEKTGSTYVIDAESAEERDLAGIFQGFEAFIEKSPFCLSLNGMSLPRKL